MSALALHSFYLKIISFLFCRGHFLKILTKITLFSFHSSVHFYLAFSACVCVCFALHAHGLLYTHPILAKPCQTLPKQHSLSLGSILIHTVLACQLPARIWHDLQPKSTAHTHARLMTALTTLLLTTNGNRPTYLLHTHANMHICMYIYMCVCVWL